MTRNSNRKHTIRAYAAEHGLTYQQAMHALDNPTPPPASPPRARKPRDYGPRQFPDAIGLTGWEFARALDDGIIPHAGANGRWPADVVDDARERITEIRNKIGDVPDLGASRAAEVIADRLGTDVDPDTIVELARRGHLHPAGDYKGHQLYSGRDIAAFRDRQVLDTAARTGRQHDRTAAAAYLNIRPADLEHLISSQWLTPITWVHSGWQRRRDVPAVPLFRTGDLDVLLAHPAIDWDEVRATPRGRPSSLAKLPRARRRR
jgi:hypothetical protein